MSSDSLSTSQHNNYNFKFDNNHNKDGNQIFGNKVSGDINVYPGPPQPTHPYKRQLPFLHQEIVGEVFQQNVERVVKWLQDPMSRIIGVWGMGGVGKTTLLEVIFNKLKENPSMAGDAHWLDVGQRCDDEFKLQEKIAKFFGVNLSGMESLGIRAGLLYDKLCNMGRMVLVLDDVWDSFTVEQIRIPLSENDCKVIFSTRDVKICHSMLCEDFVLHVETLSKGEALMLFCNALGNYEKLSGEMRQIAASVADKCHSLPLAILAIARSMRSAQSIHEWQNALNELSSLDRKNDPMEKKVYETLKFSYQRQNEDNQKCFLSCAFHLEFHARFLLRTNAMRLNDHEMSSTEVFDFWILEGLLDRIENSSEHLSKCHTILNQLVSACLFEPLIDSRSKTNCVKMHDLMRGMAIGILKENSSILVNSGFNLHNYRGKESFGTRWGWDKMLWNKDLVRVSFSRRDMEKIPHDTSPDAPNLVALWINVIPLQEIPESFFVYMKALKVLDLSRTGIERLPDSISNLEDLRALFLYQCGKLKYVPSLAKLRKLMVLDLPYKNWPYWDWDLEEVPRGMEGLKSLEKLKFCQWEGSNVIHFNSFIASAQSLTHYFFHVVGLQGKWNTSLQKIGLRSKWNLHSNMGRRYKRTIGIAAGRFGDGRTIPIVPPTAEMVNLLGIEITFQNNLVDALPSFTCITELKSLGLSFCKGFEYIATSTSTLPQFGTLKDLYLLGLDGLKRITKHASFSFSNLMEVFIGECDSLEVGIPVKSAHHHLHPLLPNLQRIQVWGCARLKDIFELNYPSSSTSTEGSKIKPILTLPKLGILRLENLPKLRSICRGLLICPSLKSSKVYECCELSLLWELSGPLICDTTPATWASIPQQEDDPEWWEPLREDYPEEVALLSSFKASEPQQEDYPEEAALISSFRASGPSSYLDKILECFFNCFCGSE